MTQEEIDKYFWLQYHGDIKATDLPREYIERDTRIYCVNEDCFVRNSCRLFSAYEALCKTFGRTVARSCIKEAVGVKRNAWETDRASELYYGNASFGINPEQRGIEPCKYHIKK